MTKTRLSLFSMLATMLLGLTLAACDLGSSGAPTPTPVPSGHERSGGVVATNTPGVISNPTATSSTGSTAGSSGVADVTPGTDAPDVPYAPAAEKLRNSGSYHFLNVKTVTLQGREIDNKAEGDVDRIGSKLKYTIGATSQGEPIQSGKAGEWVHIGDESYHKVAGAWTKEAAPTIGTDLKDVNLLVPKEQAGEPQLVGSEMVDGQDSSHYRYTAKYKNTEGATYDAWVSKSTGQIVRVRVTLPDGKIDFTATISKIDEPVSIEEPK